MTVLRGSSLLGIAALLLTASSGAAAPLLEVEEVETAAVIAPGSSFNVTWRIRNAGDAAAPAVPFLLVLSKGGRVSPSDRSLASGSTSVAAHGEAGGILEATMPASVVEGSFQVGLILDPGRSLADASKGRDSLLSSPFLVVSSGLRILTDELPSAEQGSEYCVGLDAVGGDARYVWSVADGSSLPPGLRLVELPEEARAQDEPYVSRLCGRPSTVGIFPFTLQVSSGGSAVRRDYELQVSQAALPLLISSHELAQAAFLTPFEASLRAAGGTPPYRWQLGAGALPHGLDLRVEGTIVGAAEEAGRFSFEVEVSDAAGKHERGEVVLQVAPPSRLSCGTRTLQDGAIGEDYEALLSAAGGTKPYRWRSVETRRLSGDVGDPAVSLGAAPPPGLSLAALGGIGGAPTEAGSFLWTVEVSDQGRVRAEAQCTLALDVLADSSVAVTTLGLLPAVAGRSYRMKLEASNAVGPTSWRILDGSRLPIGLSLSTTGWLEGAPELEQLEGEGEVEFPFIVEVRDSRNLRGIGALALRVLAEAPRLPSAPAATADDGGCTAAGAGGGAGALLTMALASALRRRSRA